MSKAVKPEDLGAAIQEELAIYSKSVTERVNAVGEASMRTLLRLTKRTAPKRSGGYARSITMTSKEAGHGMKRFVWLVKAPHYRLTHLLVHGHATKDGGRTKANPFLRNALDEVLPEYERQVEEAVKND